MAPVIFRFVDFGGFALYAVVGAALWLALLKSPGNLILSLRSVLMIALLLRTPMWFFPPDLSGDLWRYLWDGIVSASGQNPYSASPDDPSLVPLRQEWHSEINHPEIATIYPPYAQLLFLIPGLAGGSLLIWRILLLLLDMTAIRFLHRHDPRLSLLWTTFPLVVWEGHWNGHADLAAAAALLAAVILARRPLASGISLGVAAGIKLVPLFAFPVFLVFCRQRAQRSLAVALTLGISLLPFVGGPLMPGLSDYAERWSFNGPLYTPIVSTIEALEVDEVLRDLWTAVKDPLGLEHVSSRVYDSLHPPFVARAILACLLAGGLVVVLRRTSTVPAAVADSLALLLIVSPTVHPWYWLPVVIVALVAGREIWLFLACGSLLSYLLYENVAPSAVLILSWGAPLAAWFWLRGSGNAAKDPPESSNGAA